MLIVESSNGQIHKENKVNDQFKLLDITRAPRLGRDRQLTRQTQGFYLSLCAPCGGFTLSISADPQLSRRLDMVGADNRHDQSREALVDLCATGSVVHLDPPALAADQSRLPKRPEVLRQGRSRDGFLTDFQEIRTVLRAGRADDVDEDGRAHRVGKGMQNPFDRHVIERRMEEGFHPFHFTCT